MTQHHSPLILTAGGTSLVLDTSGPTLPRVLYWGADLGATPHSAAPFDAVSAGAADVSLPLLPLQSDRWAGRPGVVGDRSGRWPHLRLRLTSAIEHSVPADGGAILTVHAADQDAGIAVRTELCLTAEGVVRVRHTVTNGGPGVWTLSAARSVLPVPEEAGELLDLTGRWGLERVPQRSPFGFGTRAREGRHGRPDHDAATLMVAGTPGFGFRNGEVWAAHVAWSGDTEYYAERFPDSAGVLGGGELPGPGELRLEEGGSYTSPWVYFVHSDAGLDGISARLHRLLRARPQHPRSPRPVVLNTWEAVYFDHDLERLLELAEQAASIGVERFVLDDGWFRGRRDDKAGLGDWYVDEKVWPDGLHPLVDHVRSLGMEFGLWVEPEMVNPDSDLARSHPDWLLAAEGRLPAPQRHQHVLDLAHPGAFAHIHERLDALLSEYPISYLKWDHNRRLVEAVHDGAAAVHRQTLALYGLIDRLKVAHPAVEIESCASGGGRVDLGIMERTDRVWASDTNDPIDRQHIQRWTSMLLPPELIGSHIGPTTAHVTHRTTRLNLRCATALFGHAGIEWDLTRCSTEELIELKGWATAYRRLRGLIHSGTTVRADHPDATALLHGVVATDRRQAVFAYVQLDSPVASTPARLRLPGLADDLAYRVSLCPELAKSARVTGPLADGSVTVPGRVLATAGLAVPRLDPADALVLEAEAVAVPA